MLVVSGLEVVYHQVVKVLKGPSLQVPEGEIVTLLGPNGAGKTTLLRALSGLLNVHDGAITKGQITWKGQDLTKLGADEIVRLGVSQVLEGRRILADLTVAENLRAGAYSNRADGLASMFYERFPILGQRRDQKAGYLSGGEQQMLAIARALMARPKVLLLDEPSLGLAPKIVQEVADLIREIHQDGCTVLLVEQNARLALGLASYGYVMETGKIVLDGNSEDLLEDKDMQEFYLGGAHEEGAFRNVKHYRRRKRWLA
jgi:branched-chain amino acid transport system ATP-binding protein